jgi:hypothetical protein
MECLLEKVKIPVTLIYLKRPLLFCHLLIWLQQPLSHQLLGAGCACYTGSRVDVSPTENSWMLRPLNKASLGYFVPDRCVPTPSMKLAPSAAIAASVSLRHLMNQWGVWPASPTPLTRFIDRRPSIGCYSAHT